MYIRPSSFPSINRVQDKPITPVISDNAKDAFSGVLEKASSTLESIDQEALRSQLELVSGNAKDMHTAVLSAEKASLALDLVVSVRNKALEAYQEIMRMPV